MDARDLLDLVWIVPALPALGAAVLATALAMVLETVLVLVQATAMEIHQILHLRVAPDIMETSNLL